MTDLDLSNRLGEDFAKPVAGRPGRPSIYTEELAEEIIERLSNGEPLAQICRDERMPALRTVYYWEESVDGFFARIARGRLVGFDQIAFDTMEIADDKSKDFIVTEDGRRIFNPEAVMRSKLRVETRLKLLAKWDRKRYGDEAPSTNVNLTNSVTNVLAITEERRQKLIEMRWAANERLRLRKQERDASSSH